MDFFYDCEFHDDGRTIEPISIGIVAGDGAELYREFADTFYNHDQLDRIRRHPWLMANVVPHLSDRARSIVHGTANIEDVVAPAAHPILMNNWAAADDIRTFIQGYGESRATHRLWAWYGAYDYVMLAQLFGPMIRLPECVPMFTYDLNAFVDQRERVTGRSVLLPKQAGNLHNALADARWVRDAKLSLDRDGTAPAPQAA